MKRATTSLLLLVIVAVSCREVRRPAAPPVDAAAIHSTAIVIDGHVDTPQKMLLSSFDLGAHHADAVHFDLERAKAGNLGAQFFSIYVPPEVKDGYWRYATRLIDVVRAQTTRYPARMQLAWSADDVRRARAASPPRLAVMMGLEGAHALEGDVNRLRELRNLGVRYIGLTWNNTNELADSGGGPATHGGLSALGERAIGDMNRLGLVVDVSHASDETLDDTLRVSQAPIIASHSGSRALADHKRNLSDDSLRAIAKNRGVVMVIFFAPFVDKVYLERFNAQASARGASVDAAVSPFGGTWSEAFMKAEIAAEKPFLDQLPRPPLDSLLDQIDHVVRVAGIDHVGLGSDFDGVHAFPAGIDSVADLPKITAGLVTRGYRADQIHKILGGNLLRALEECDAVAARSHDVDGTAVPKRE